LLFIVFFVAQPQLFSGSQAEQWEPQPPPAPLLRRHVVGEPLGQFMKRTGYLLDV